MDEKLITLERIISDTAKTHLASQNVNVVEALIVMKAVYADFLAMYVDYTTINGIKDPNPEPVEEHTGTIDDLMRDINGNNNQKSDC